MEFKEIDKDTDKRILKILFTIILTGVSFYLIMKSDIKTTDMAMYWSSYGTVLQAVFAAFQAIFAGIIIIITRSLATKQAALAIQQNEIVKEQNEMTRRQINLALYDKRYKIYKGCIELLLQFGIKDINVYKFGTNREEYNYKIRRYCEAFLEEIAEKDFLFDDALARYIDSIYDMVNKLQTELMYNGADTLEIVEKIKPIRNELSFVKDKFKPYLDFKKI